jgi:hypothetical protein
MIDPYIQITFTDKQLFLLKVAAECKIKWFNEKTNNDEYDGEDIEGWDENDIALLGITVKKFNEIFELRRAQIAEEIKQKGDD